MLIHLVSCGIHWYHRLVPSIGTIIVVLPAVVPSVVLPAVVPTVVPIVILPEVVPTVVPIVVLPVLVPCVASMMCCVLWSMCSVSSSYDPSPAQLWCSLICVGAVKEMN